MPQVGETKTVNGVTGRWDGQTWRKVDAAPADTSGQGYHPSLADSDHPFISALKGFVSGAANAATPGKIGLLSALAIPGAGEAALAGAGATTGLDLLRSYFDEPNAPKTGGQYVRDEVESALPAVVGGVTNKIVGAIPDAGLAIASKVPGKIGLAAKVLQAARAAAPEAADVAGDASGFRPSVPKTVNWSGPDVAGDFERATAPQSTEQYWSRSGPNTEFQAGAPRLVKTGSPSLEDTLNDFLQNGMGEESAAPTGDTPSVRSVDRGNAPDLMKQYVDSVSGPVPEFEMDGVTYRPDASGSHVAVSTSAPATAPAPARPVMPEDIGYGANGDLGAGISAGNDSMLPSEYRVEDESWYKPQATASPANATTAPSTSNLPQSLQAIDRLFGPGTKDLAGEPFQSTTGGPGTGSNNLLYDPQTPSDYLREQAQAPETPDADREFLLRALRQRLRLGQSAGYQDIIPQQ